MTDPFVYTITRAKQYNITFLLLKWDHHFLEDDDEGAAAVEGEEDERPWRIPTSRPAPMAAILAN